MAVASVVAAPVALADPSPTTGVELEVSPDQFVGQPGVFNPVASRTEGIQALKQLRTIMWKENPPFIPLFSESDPAKQNYRLRDAARDEGITTLEEYLKVSSDEDLAWIATQRAFEAATTRAHKRPDGGAYNTALRNGISPRGENLAFGNRSLGSFIVDRWGKSELPALRRSGKLDSSNGHLYWLINPKNTVWGFGGGTFYTPNPSMAWAAVTSDTAVGSDNSPNELMTTWMFRSPAPGEQPTGVKSGTPKIPTTPTIGGGTLSPGAAAGSAGGQGGVIGMLTALVGISSILAAIAQFFGQFAPR